MGRWLDYVSIFGHLMQPKFAVHTTQYKTFTKVGSTFGQILPKIAKDFYNYTKVAKFRQSRSHWLHHSVELFPFDVNFSSLGKTVDSNYCRRTCVSCHFLAVHFWSKFRPNYCLPFLLILTSWIIQRHF